MNKTINVLFIEDNPGDARLVKEELRSASSGTIVHVEWVDRLELGLARLASNHLAAVLLDLNLPDSEGLETLKRVIASAPAIPVIVMTGQADEALAMQAVQAGAQDYLIKGQVDGRLLTRSIQYAIQRKQAEVALRESEERFRLVVESAPSAMIVVDKSGRINLSNTQAGQLFGYSRGELLGQPIELLVPHHFHQQHRQLHQEYLSQPHALAIGIRRPLSGSHKDGHEIPLEIGLAPYESSEGLRVLALINDISERQRAQAELQAQTLALARSNGLIAALSNVAVRVASLPDMQSLMETLGQELKELNLEVVIALLEPGAQSLRVRYVTAAGPSLTLAQNMTGLSLIGFCIERDRWPGFARVVDEQLPSFLPDSLEFVMSLINRPLPRPVLRQALKLVNVTSDTPILCLPLTIDQRAMGAMMVWGPDLQESDGAAALIFCAHIAAALENARLYQAVQEELAARKQAEERIQHQLRRLNGLRAIDVAISSSFDVHVILDIILQQVLFQLGVDAAAVLLVNSEEQTIEYAASRGFRSEALHHTQLKLDQGYAGRAVRELHTIHVPDLSAPGIKLAAVIQLAEEDFVNYYGTPLIAKGEVQGVLEIYHRSPLNPDREWLDFLETLAGQAAIAIDNAQLFDALQRSNAELERRVAERTEELNRTNKELEQANRAKDEFLATMSHELRTPLNSILGLSETLQEQRRDPLSEYQQRSLQIVQSSGEHLLALINDILDLSKIEAGKFDYYPQIVSVDDLCRASIAFVRSQAARKSITITYINEGSINRILADPRRLKQILVNLLTNAVKFTLENGQVRLQVNTDLEYDFIRFSVIDTGIGIAPEDLKRLFRPFVQVDSSLNRQYDGTGLGLALVQRLTDLHGGSIHVESEVGKGSRFIINLACKSDEIAQLEIPSPQTMQPASLQAHLTSNDSEASTPRGLILLAEDNMANILTIGEYLQSHGYEVVVTHDGLEAIERAKATNPDIILMDIQMPVLNGLDAMRNLRRDPRFVTTPIIALTALAMPGDRERCLEAGASEYMSKPVSLKMLLKTIRELLTQGE